MTCKPDEIIVGVSMTRYVRTLAGEWNSDVTSRDIIERLLDEALDDLVATREARDGYIRQNADLIDEAIRQRDEARRERDEALSDLADARASYADALKEDGTQRDDLDREAIALLSGAEMATKGGAE